MWKSFILNIMSYVVMEIKKYKSYLKIEKENNGIGLNMKIDLQ